MTRFTVVIAMTACSLLQPDLAAQQTGPASDSAKPASRPRRGGPRNLANLIPPLQESGFRPIFDGKTLNGWDGNPSLWRVEDDVIIGETTAEKPIKQNSFLIWRGGKPADFELKVEYRLTGGNTGVQYRSEEVPNVEWGLRGYQGDIDAQQTYTGQIYEERGRGFLALRGQATYIGDGQKPGLIGTLGQGEELKGLLKSDDWNSFHVIARGNTLVQIVNGRIMSIVIDDDSANRKLEGLIGFQVHVGPPMKLELRNIRLKTY